MTDVLIVGAGPVGLALACELKKRNIQVRVIDQKEGPSVHSKALGLQARTLELLQQAGIVNDFLERGLKLKGAIYHGKRKPIRFSLAETLVDTSYPFILILPQSETENILLKHFEQLGGIIEWKTTLLDIIENNALIEHSDQKREMVSSSWIVGCDGAHSRVRETLSFSFKGIKFPEINLIADVKAPPQLDRCYGHLFLNKNGLEVILPLPQENTYRVILRSSKKFKKPLNNDEMLHLLKEKAHLQIQAVEWISEFHIHRRITPHLRKGPVFLAGDAAHIHSPAGGQGLNTGIQDAINLAWKLALVIQGASSEALLDSYETERIIIAKEVLKGTTKATKILTFAQKRGRPLFEWGFRLLLLRKKFRLKLASTLSELAIHYRNSPLTRAMARDKEWKGPRPGERAPDGNLEGGKSLFDLFKTSKHVLLLFEDRPSFSQAIVSEYGSWIDIHIIKSEDIKRKYHAGPQTLYLIRPDGYVGYCSFAFKTKEVVAYLLRIFKPASQRSKL
ncbi:MAG: FAD-dependent monooxygenase [Chlamydiales bacterium]